MGDDGHDGGKEFKAFIGGIPWSYDSDALKGGGCRPPVRSPRALPPRGALLLRRRAAASKEYGRHTLPWLTPPAATVVLRVSSHRLVGLAPRRLPCRLPCCLTVPHLPSPRRSDHRHRSPDREPLHSALPARPTCSLLQVWGHLGRRDARQDDQQAARLRLRGVPGPGRPGRRHRGDAQHAAGGEEDLRDGGGAAGQDAQVGGPPALLRRPLPAPALRCGRCCSRRTHARPEPCACASRWPR
jgi:hypothetical protein